jgi:hypothetical protein
MSVGVMKDYKLKLRDLRASHIGRGTGTPNWDKDEVNKREVCECEGWVWDLDAIGTPSRLRLIRKAAALASRFPIFDWTPETAKKLFVYYESIKRELKIRCIYECRCDERLQTKTKEFTRLTYTGLVVEHEVNRREVCECDGWVCDLEVIAAPSRLRWIRKTAALAKIDETRDLSIEEKAARRKW